MSITKAFIQQVKEHRAKTWHDKAWHDFNDSPGVIAVGYALNELGDTADTESLIIEAEDYLASVEPLTEVVDSVLDYASFEVGEVWPDMPEGSYTKE